MLVFEQSLVHEGVPPAQPHIKYIIRSDVMFQRDPAICDSPQDVAAYALLMQVGTSTSTITITHPCTNAPLDTSFQG
jgi:hypothetical protein